MAIANQKTGRTLVTIAIALLLLMFVGAIIVAGRKKTAPEQEPPLPPSSFVTAIPPAYTRAWATPGLEKIFKEPHSGGHGIKDDAISQGAQAVQRIFEN